MFEVPPKNNRQFMDLYYTGDLEDFEVTSSYSYFDYSHEELLAAVSCGQQIAVGTIVTDLACTREGDYSEDAIWLDPKHGGCVIARMFNGFDVQSWEAAVEVANALRSALREFMENPPLRVVGLVLGAKRDDLLVPNRLRDLILGEDDVKDFGKCLAERFPAHPDAELLCRRIVEVAGFVDSKEPHEIREIPSWLAQELNPTLLSPCGAEERDK